MESADEEEAWIAEQADAPLPEEVAESLQETHESDVARQAAQTAAAARAADDISDSVIADAEPPALFVKRGGRHYAPALKAKLRPGEHVFAKRPGRRHFPIYRHHRFPVRPPDAPIIIP